MSLRDVEGEIARLEGDEEQPRPPIGPPPGFEKFFEGLLQQQTVQHASLLKTLAENTQQTATAVASAVSASLQPEPRPRTTATRAAPTIDHVGLFEAAADPPVPPQEGEGSSDEEYDFPGWVLPDPGQAVHQEIAEPVVHLPGPSSQPDLPIPAVIPEGLFCQDKVPNWDPPQDLLAWLEGINGKEVPAKSLNEISENFIPQEKYQTLFTAPPLPQAISDRMASAPRYLTKVPKLVNDQLSRSQKELMIACELYLLIEFVLINISL